MKNKPKILFIMHMPPPMHGAAQIGQYIHDSKLINDSFECTYINPSASDNVKDVGKLSLKKILFLFSFLRRINKMVDDIHPDLVYITPSSDGWGFYRDFVNVYLLKQKSCRIIAHFHNKPSKHFSRKWYNQWIYRCFFKGLYTIFLSKRLLPDLQKYINKERNFICPNGIKYNDRKSYVREANSSKSFNFLFLSNMMEEKGVYVLLEACKYLKERGCDFTCTFIGRWSDVTETNFMDKLEEYAIDDCVFALGAKYGEEKNEYFHNSDCFVFPTFYHSECFPLVLLEAMSFALPCISTNEGAILDIVDDGKTGSISSVTDAKSLAEKMLFLISHRDIALQMGASGREKFVRNYTYDAFEKNMYLILNKSLK